MIGKAETTGTGRQMAQGDAYTGRVLVVPKIASSEFNLGVRNPVMFDRTQSVDRTQSFTLLRRSNSHCPVA